MAPPGNPRGRDGAENAERQGGVNEGNGGDCKHKDGLFKAGGI